MDTVTVIPKPKTTNGKIRRRSGTAIKQYLPFPDTLIYYTVMNPRSPKAYNKMIRSCKYFFDVNPILVVAYMCEPNYYIFSGKTRICSNEKLFSDLSFGICCINVDFRKISCKIWVTRQLRLDKNIYTNNIPNFSSLFFAKLYRHEIKELVLNNTSIQLNDFKILAQFVVRLKSFGGLKMFDRDEKIVLLDKTLSVCPKLEYFNHDFNYATNYSIISSSTLKNISKLQNLSNLKKFKLENVPEIFDIQDVSDFVTKNFMDTEIQLHLGRAASAEYQVQLDTIRKKIHELKIRRHFIF